MVMKVVAAATAVLAFAGSALAQPAVKTWTDEKNRLTLEVPQSWPVDRQSKPDEDFVWLIAGPADAECNIFVLPNENTGAASADRVLKAYSKPYGVEGWTKALGDFNMFSGATVMTTDTASDRTWPLQSAEFSLADGTPAYGATQGRPGFEVWQFCRSYDGKDRTALFADIARSVKATQDEEWAAVIADAAAKAAAAAAAPPPEPAKQDKKSKK